MPRAIAKVKEETRKLLVTAVLFSIGFCIILVHNRLLTEGTSFRAVSFARALIGGLIVAKALLSVDMLPFLDAKSMLAWQRWPDQLRNQANNGLHASPA